MYGMFHLRLLDTVVHAAASTARIARTVLAVALHPTRWRPTDLYAAAQTAPLYAQHALIDQAADAADHSDTEVELVAARAWPWLGGRYVYTDPGDDG
ncbi:hypothetical protein [Streptomyces aidingensis]|uniref:Uncharacterized protein n=1 Tax=Streptomyces aidingensis TaxID=910347 RepID=A0A1I1V083_9ACTN|nr:hypothetical protein [Streptomyces aidingensis]SFD74493.1 hypothetical protein SAMN05421773_12722 [Streptomyces aidingensis]